MLLNLTVPTIIKLEKKMRELIIKKIKEINKKNIEVDKTDFEYTTEFEETSDDKLIEILEGMLNRNFILQSRR
jgi:hypothetical protein